MRLGLGLGLSGHRSAVPVVVPSVEIVGRTQADSEPRPDGFYRLTKTGGGTGWNADAVSVEPITGPFAIQITPVQSAGDSGFGVSVDPAVSASYTQIDFNVGIAGSAFYVLYGASLQDGGPHTFSGSIWLIRDENDVLTFNSGSTLTEALATVRHTVADPQPGPLYFDSSLYLSAVIADVKFGPLEAF